MYFQNKYSFIRLKAIFKKLLALKTGKKISIFSLTREVYSDSPIHYKNFPEQIHAVRESILLPFKKLPHENITSKSDLISSRIKGL